ncbi:MAG: 2,3-bisphosphoglycerate-independent phosphoglycerate mutase [Armatimonadota bacterium]
MKYVMVILDGAVDAPIKALDDRTPLIVGAGEHLTAMARKARVGVVQTLPPDWKGDPEAALMGLFGFDPVEHWTGRGPLEAAAVEIDLDHGDTAFSLNLVHTDGAVLQEPTAGKLGKNVGRELVRHVQQSLRHRTLQFYPGSGYRHVLVWRGGPDGIACTSPYAAAGRPLREVFPTGDRAEQLVSVMWDSAEVLAEHPFNKRLRDDGRPTADMVWPWSPGRAPQLQGFGFRHGVGGSCVAGSAMVKGLARLSGLRVLDVPGATGSLDTDYAMKARATLTALQERDFCLVHLESPNEAGLDGDWEAKLDAVKRIDERFFGTLLDRIGLLDDFRIMVVVDHATYTEERRAEAGWMPFMITGSREAPQTRGILPFDERAIDDARWRIDKASELLPQLFEGETA